MEDAKAFGCRLVLGSKVTKIVERNDNNSNSNNKNIIELYTKSNDTGRKKYTTNYLINTAGGNAVDVAHSMGVARDYTDLHFRGEYWQAPTEYRDLTKISIYTVPKYPQYPFLDPHWIVRIDGRREIGPNAVPVSGPYAYNWSTNLKYLIPKIFESSKAGTRKMLADKQFLSLASNELKSSLSKTAMINRAREFLPQIRPSSFTQRGTAGIRSSLIDRNGKFVDDTMIITKDNSLHVLNYNSPGATGALPMAAMIANRLIEDGRILSLSGFSSSSSSNNINNSKQPVWDIRTIAHQMPISNA
jgi:L-2-hydroxyglutarate oxidase